MKTAPSSLSRKHINSKMSVQWFERAIRLPLRGRVAFFVMVLLSFHLQGQQLFFKQFSVSEGLAQSTVFKVIQDSEDIYWLGTQAGVSSFDGTRFSNFSSGNGLAENGVRAICEDRNASVWFGHTGGGVSRYRGKKFEEIESMDSLINSNVTSIVEDSAGHIWITTQASGVIEILNPGAEKRNLAFRKYKGSEISDRVFGGYVDPHGGLYFVADPNVKVYNSDSARFDNLIMNGIPQYYATTCILADHRGNFWFGKYNGGLYRYDPETDQSSMFDLIKAGLTSNWVSTLFEDNLGNIWAGTWGGGMVRINSEYEVELFSSRNGLPGMKIWTIMQDREENILIGTHENGLCVYKGDHFVSYFEGDGLINSQVWSILQASSGEIWFGTNEGISIFEDGSGGGSFRDFQKLKGVRITFLKEDGNGTIWIGSLNQGVYSYERNGRFHFDPLINNNISNLQVTAMDLDPGNNLWIGTMEGLVYFETENRRVALLSQLNGLKGSDISAVFADAGDRIWVGSAGKGVSVIEGDSIGQLDLGFDFTPRCFTEDLDGNIWIGTEGRGVVVFNPGQKQVVRTLSEQDGLLANLINQLSCDRFNNVYIGTNKGLNAFIRNGEHIYAFTPSSGFVGIETRHNATMADKKGNMWFGTVEGATRYTPSIEGIRTIEPLTHITGFQVNHESFPLSRDQRFSHKQNSMIFEYRCITLNPDAVLYSIMLEGVDHDWRPPVPQTQVTYPALRPGRYRFMVKARSSEGVWNTEPVSFQFYIRPPFYLTWYFILAMIFAAGVVIFAFIKVRERALRRENAILEEKVRHRTAMVVAQKEELAQKNKDITDSIRYAKRIQFAILPEKPPFRDTFVLFKPKDIVSGDFYWFQEVDGRQFLAAVDCTGHGVPGAFMSIIGHNSLTKIVREYGILEPGKILTQLNKEVVSTLHQRSDAGDVLDGMDLALASYIPDEHLLEFAGAFNPLYLVREGEILETRADKVSIGRSSLNTSIEYTNHRMEVRPGDTIYLFSDGYADQFGGQLMKKFKYNNLKALILRIQDQPMEQQRRILDLTIEEWRGDVEQLDDILVIGRRF
jgi:ligand-binding sensor domain-containing protein/serine phosphatase RsbU (regulator of sigma subunit)